MGAFDIEILNLKKNAEKSLAKSLKVFYIINTGQFKEKSFMIFLKYKLRYKLKYIILFVIFSLIAVKFNFTEKEVIASELSSINQRMSQAGVDGDLSSRPLEGMPQGMRMPMTEEQSIKVDQIVQKYQPKMEPFLVKLNELTGEIQKLLGSPDLSNEQKIREKHDEFLKVEPEFKRLQLEMALEIRRVMNGK